MGNTLEKLAAIPSRTWSGFFIALSAVLVGVMAQLKGAPDWSNSYVQIPLHLVEQGLYSVGGRQPTAFRPPGYPLYVAGLMLLLKSQWHLLWILFQAAIAGLNCHLLLRIVRSITPVALATALAGLLYVGNIALLQEFASFRDTLLYALLTLLFVFGFTRARSNYRFALMAGLLAGAAILVRPSGITLLPAAVIAIFLLPLPGNRWAAIALFVAAAALPVLPWLGFTQHTQGHFSISGSNTSGMNLFKGNHPLSRNLAVWGDVDSSEPAINALLATHGRTPTFDGAAAWENDALLKSLAVDAIKADPGAFVLRTTAKGLLFLFQVPAPLGDGDFAVQAGTGRLTHYRLLNPLKLLADFAMSLLALAGALAFGVQQARSGSRSTSGACLAALLVFLLLNTALYALCFPESRFRYPILLWMMPFAAAWYANLVLRLGGVGARDSAS